MHPLFVVEDRYIDSFQVDESATPPRYDSKSLLTNTGRKWLFDI